MILVDSVMLRREAENRPIRVGMVGCGFMGRAVTRQIVNSTPGMLLVAIANRSPNAAVSAYRAAGVEPVFATGTTALNRIVGRGQVAVLDDAFALIESDMIDCVVDVTGAVEFGARVTLAAIEHKLPVVSLNAELDGTVGPLLAYLARQVGVVFTASDGD